MKQRPLLLLGCISVLFIFAATGSQKKSELLLLEWARKAPAEKVPIAVLIELGVMDNTPTSWSGHATVEGAKVVKREAYRFRQGDQLEEPNGWKASSHRAAQLQQPILKPGQPKAPPNPALRLAQRMASVGVVLHLTDVQPDAKLAIEAGEKPEKAEVPLQEVLGGKRHVLWNAKAVVRLISTARPVASANTEDDFPAASYGPDGTLWVAYIAYTLKVERRRTPLNQIPEEPADFKDYYKPEFGDQLLVKYYRNGKWSEPLQVTGPKEDLVRCAIAVEGSGRAWVAYSANRQGKFDIYARPIDNKGDAPQLGQEQKLTREPGPALTPVMCTDQEGNVELACQIWRPGQTQGPGPRQAWAGIDQFTCRDGKWTPESSSPPGNVRWYPAIAASADGKIALGHDRYNGNDYDVGVAVLPSGAPPDLGISSPRFEARPSLAYDPQGRLWIAYEEGQEKWGKDFGALVTDQGNPLYKERSVRVACLVDGKLMKPVAELPTSQARPMQIQPNLQTPRYAYPKIGIDGKGRVWLTYRHKLPTPFGVQPGTDWITYARRLDGDHWTEPIEIAHSDGLLDSRPVLLPHAGGGLLVITNTDHRYTKPGTFHNQIYANIIDLPGDPVEPNLVAKEAEKPGDIDRDEAAAVARMRSYRLEMGGKKYQLLRGEFHRHTEISFDGGADGSLEDMFRYAIDAASLDWIANTDHDSGAAREYTWWLIQKYSDAYHVAPDFTPMFAYERSQAYPHGHRNPIFAKRGVMTLPRLGERANISANDTKMLYRYLKEMDGICASHTSATNMGTDWRDNDPQVEPIVEIYQGDRNNYEKEGAPRAGYPADSGNKPVNIAGWFPKGYINLAFDKGYRLGFQSSSDHISTHISYCVALTEGVSREAILEALKKRRCYAATDNIVVDVRSGEHLMGEEFKTNAVPTLQIHIVGTKPLAVEILKDSEIVETLKPGKPEYQGTWTDPKPSEGVHYYYIRVEQEDGQLAWASPMWINFSP